MGFCEVLIYRELFKEYNVFVRLVKNFFMLIIVEISLILRIVYDLEEKWNILYFLIEIEMIWMDDFLLWNVIEMGGIKVIFVLMKRIWILNICVKNDILNINCFGIYLIV